MEIEGKVLKYGDYIDTDVIIAGKYTKTLDMGELASRAMEDLDSDFHRKLDTGDFIVAGKEFGCGSSREQAPLALKHAGVGCIVAPSFARIFYRNAINIGLPLIECDVDAIQAGDRLRYDLNSNTLMNVTTGQQLVIKPLPRIMVDILQEGGLIHYLQKHGGYQL